MKFIQSLCKSYFYYLIAVLVVLLFTSLVALTDWVTVLIAAAIAGLTVGFATYLCNWQKRRIEARLITDVRNTLTDVVKNELAALALYIEVAERKPERLSELQDVYQSMRDYINGAIDSLSGDSIRQWKQRYDISESGTSF